MNWKPVFKEDFPQFQQNQNIFQYIYDSVINKNESWDFFIAQQRGMGKSTIAIAIAKMLDSNFSVDNICFTVKDFVELMTTKQPKGSIVIFDDLGTAKGGSSRKWQSGQAHDIADIMQLNRTDGIITIGTSIELDRTEKRLRAGFRCLISPTVKLSHTQTGNGMAIDIEMRIKSIDVFNDEPIFKLWRYADGGRIKLIRLYHPDSLFWNEYQRKRLEYLSTLKK